ncbi:nickel pincer cofactor biosynthesis protein LarC [Anaerovorax odorimutans]|uniref:nickel pincer cofactor biosynthesis protein LarC n=1 Tax=Anaerovorax odorimutans TaxID=109327 RepID=UPI000409FD30|nr:nickel pincer cofactor biosynthesis protein LarC [Anaerovorax odorimutans]
MEKILYFDCFAGISGDMTIAALVDLGLDEKKVIEEIKKLGVRGYEIEIKKVNRFSISGTDVKVVLNGDINCEHYHHDHSNDEQNNNHHHHHHNNRERSLTDISHIINSSDISENSKKIAIEIFTEIAKAEAVVHGKSLGEVHFHEVGAVDSIVDIVGTAICIDMLGVDEIVCSPVHDGQGFVDCQHGRLPIPVPAVVQMMKDSGITVITEDVQAELVTPTGFGILKTLKESCGKMPPMQVEKVGYGFGKTETGRLNALRVVLGYGDKDIISNYGDVKDDKVLIMETNIDDCSSEVLGYVFDKLMDAGALDVYFIPIHMKKNRPGVILSVICKKEDSEKLSAIIFSETGTLGIRVNETNRMVLDRDIRIISTSFGPIRAKVSKMNGKDKFKPELDDCVKIAKELGLPLKEVISIINSR